LVIAALTLSVSMGSEPRNMVRQLDVSPATAKVHRRNLYWKLTISSPATLFLLIMGEE
jgi:DNA-binding NarL/FixJ family response regulator